MSVIGSIKAGSRCPSNESHQPTDPAKCPRYHVDPGPKNKQRADKIQQPTDTLGLHSVGSGKLSALQNRCFRETASRCRWQECRRNYRIASVSEEGDLSTAPRRVAVHRASRPTRKRDAIGLGRIGKHLATTPDVTGYGPADDKRVIITFVTRDRWPGESDVSFASCERPA